MLYGWPDNLHLPRLCCTTSRDHMKDRPETLARLAGMGHGIGVLVDADQNAVRREIHEQLFAEPGRTPEPRPLVFVRPVRPYIAEKYRITGLPL